MRIRNTIACVMLGAAAFAVADTVVLDYENVVGTSNGSIYAGLINVTESSSAHGSAPFGVYCLDPGTLLKDSWTYDKTIDTPAVCSQIVYIAYTYRSEVANNWEPYELAGAQLAIWNLSSGYGIANSGFGEDARTYASTVLSASAGEQHAHYVYYNPVPKDGMTSQTLIRATDGPTGGDPVPEPFTLLLGVGALGAAVAARRRSRRD